MPTLNLTYTAESNFLQSLCAAAQNVLVESFARLLTSSLAKSINRSVDGSVAFRLVDLDIDMDLILNRLS